MSIFKKPKTTVHHSAIEVSAARALIQGISTQESVIQFKFEMEDQIIEIELDIKAAAKLLSDAANAYDAIAPRRRW